MTNMLKKSAASLLLLLLLTTSTITEKIDCKEEMKTCKECRKPEGDESKDKTPCVECKTDGFFNHYSECFSCTSEHAKGYSCKTCGNSGCESCESGFEIKKILITGYSKKLSICTKSVGKPWLWIVISSVATLAMVLVIWLVFCKKKDTGNDLYDSMVQETGV